MTGRGSGPPGGTPQTYVWKLFPCNIVIVGPTVTLLQRGFTPVRLGGEPWEQMLKSIVPSDNRKKLQSLCNGFHWQWTAFSTEKGKSLSRKWLHQEWPTNRQSPTPSPLRFTSTHYLVLNKVLCDGYRGDCKTYGDLYWLSAAWSDYRGHTDMVER